MNNFVAIILLLGLVVIGAGLGQQLASKEATTHLQFETVAAGVCTVEGGGKTFMVIDVTKEMSDEPMPEEAE